MKKELIKHLEQGSDSEKRDDNDVRVPGPTFVEKIRTTIWYSNPILEQSRKQTILWLLGHLREVKQARTKIDCWNIFFPDEKSHSIVRDSYCTTKL